MVEACIVIFATGDGYMTFNANTAEKQIRLDYENCYDTSNSSHCVFTAHRMHNPIHDNSTLPSTLVSFSPSIKAEKTYPGLL
jgi:hypothetical protein